MAVMNVNPTRMEMKRLQQRLKTATRGHKLLKDKTDEMIRRFITLAEENKRLRRETEKDLAKALSSFTLARSQTAGQETFLFPNLAVLRRRLRPCSLMLLLQKMHAISVPKHLLWTNCEISCRILMAAT